MSWLDPFNMTEQVTDTFFPNPANGAMGYLDQNPDIYHQYYDPYVNMGLNTMPSLEEQYAMLMNNPQMMQQMLGGGYEQSPGYQYQYDTAMNAGNQAAAAGGMLGTPAHTTQMMGTAQGLANQDYWNYYNQNANLYGQGLKGTQGLFNTGFDATNALASGLGSTYGNQANAAYGNMQSQNQMLASVLGAGVGGATYGWMNK